MSLSWGSRRHRWELSKCCLRGSLAALPGGDGAQGRKIPICATAKGHLEELSLHGRGQHPAAPSHAGLDGQEKPNSLGQKTQCQCPVQCLASLWCPQPKNPRATTRSPPLPTSRSTASPTQTHFWGSTPPRSPREPDAGMMPTSLTISRPSRGISALTVRHAPRHGVGLRGGRRPRGTHPRRGRQHKPL